MNLNEMLKLVEWYRKLMYSEKIKYSYYTASFGIDNYKEGSYSSKIKVVNKNQNNGL